METFINFPHKFHSIGIPFILVLQNLDIDRNGIKDFATSIRELVCVYVCVYVYVYIRIRCKCK